MKKITCKEAKAKGKKSILLANHIIPLQGEVVCGLHVQGNFQIIDIAYNRIKSNLFKEI